jgi:hypothetical protein
LGGIEWIKRRRRIIMSIELSTLINKIEVILNKMMHHNNGFP